MRSNNPWIVGNIRMILLTFIKVYIKVIIPINIKKIYSNLNIF